MTRKKPRMLITPIMSILMLCDGNDCANFHLLSPRGFDNYHARVERSLFYTNENFFKSLESLSIVRIVCIVFRGRVSRKYHPKILAKS